VNNKPWKQKAYSEMELNAIQRIVIPITYVRINSLIEKILRKHC